MKDRPNVGKSGGLSQTHIHIRKLYQRGPFSSQYNSQNQKIQVFLFSSWKPYSQWNTAHWNQYQLFGNCTEQSQKIGGWVGRWGEWTNTKALFLSYNLWCLQQNFPYTHIQLFSNVIIQQIIYLLILFWHVSQI